MCWMLDGSTAYSRHWTSTHLPSLLSSLQVGAGQLRYFLPHTTNIHPSPCHLPPASVCLSRGVWGLLGSSWKAWGWMGRQVECRLSVQGT